MYYIHVFNLTTNDDDDDEIITDQQSVIILTLLINLMKFVVLLLGVNLIIGMPTQRMRKADQPFIENILEKYSSISDLRVLALGSSYWSPPSQALATLSFEKTEIHKYGSILGYDPLRTKILSRLQSESVDISDLDVVITCGANQAFYNVALALCDDKQKSGILA